MNLSKQIYSLVRLRVPTFRPRVQPFTTRNLTQSSTRTMASNPTPTNTTTPPASQAQSNSEQPSSQAQDPSPPSPSTGPLPLPEPSSDATNLAVNGDGVKLDHLGPLVVNKDGSLSRIANWENMAEIERQNTLRILGKRNQLRLGALKGEGKKE